MSFNCLVAYILSLLYKQYTHNMAFTIKTLTFIFKTSNMKYEIITNNKLYLLIGAIYDSSICHVSYWVVGRNILFSSITNDEFNNILRNVGYNSIEYIHMLGVSTVNTLLKRI